MKSKLQVFALLVAFVGGAAAASIPNQEVASEKARLSEFSPQGEVTPGYEKTLVVFRGTEEIPTKFYFAEERQTDTGIKRIRHVFNFSGKKEMHCGSVRYFGTETEKNGIVREIQLDDHTHRFCDDYRKFVWDVRVTQNGKVLRVFGGSPEAQLVTRALNFGPLQD